VTDLTPPTTEAATTPDLMPPTAEAVTTPDLMPPTTEAATPELVAPGASDLCANCQAPLASDQRYCVNCGERRGRPRQAFQPTASKASDPTPPKRERRPRASAGTTLIAGVATLLLAMGVGVLIGQNGTSSNGKLASAAAPPVKVTVDNGGGGGSGSTATASTGSRSKKAGKKGSAKHSAAPAAHLSKKTTAAVNQGAANVVGTTQKLAPATVKVGGSCQNGEAGCQNGKFTGGFFPGG
jgi:hypothetical protein